MPTDNVQCETISLIKFQPSHGAVDFLKNLGVFRWENPNLDFSFYFNNSNNFYKNDDTFEAKFTRHVSVVQQPSSVESRINLELH